MEQTLHHVIGKPEVSVVGVLTPKESWPIWDGRFSEAHTGAAHADRGQAAQARGMTSRGCDNGAAYIGLLPRGISKRRRER